MFSSSSGVHSSLLYPSWHLVARAPPMIKKGYATSSLSFITPCSSPASIGLQVHPYSELAEELWFSSVSLLSLWAFIPLGISNYPATPIGGLITRVFLFYYIRF